MPVQSSNCFQDAMYLSDSGEMIDAKIDTCVPLWPWYAEYDAHAGLLADGALPPPPLELEQAASSSPAAAAPTSANLVRLARGVMCLSQRGRRTRAARRGRVNAHIVARARQRRQGFQHMSCMYTVTKWHRSRRVSCPA